MEEKLGNQQSYIFKKESKPSRIDAWEKSYVSTKT